MKTQTTINLKDNPNNVYPDTNTLYVNKNNGNIGRILSRTNNKNICEFWFLPSGIKTPIPQLAYQLEKLPNYKGKDLGGYDPITQSWKKQYIDNHQIIAMVWRNEQIMLELDNYTFVPLEEGLSNRKQAKTLKPTTKTIDIADIIIDTQLQLRVEINDSAVKEYAELIENNYTFPPITVFSEDNKSYWLVDGFHRFLAYQSNNHLTITCEVYHGSFEKAKIYSYSVNSTHGMPRSQEDKRKAVLSAFKDPLLEGYSNREIAKLLNVSRRFVDKLRLSLEPTQNEEIHTKASNGVAEAITKELKNIKAEIEADVTKTNKVKDNTSLPPNNICDLNIHQDTLDKLRFVKEASNLQSVEDTINYLIDIYMKTK